MLKYFFRSRQFKTAVVVLAVIIVVSLTAGLVGGVIAPHTGIFGSVMAPFQKIATDISENLKAFSERLKNNESFILENAELQKEIDRLNNKISDYEAMKAENEFYKEYLEIKDANPDFKFSSASVISRDNLDVFGGFTIDSGTSDGVEAYDPVITEAGLIGYVSEVGATTSKVTTILSGGISVGAIDSRTSDAGVVGGTLQLAQEAKTRMYNIQRSSGIAIGDYIVTSGSGVFPAGLNIGRVVNISQEQYSTALYAELEPFADIKNVHKVMVITDFEGKNQIKLH